ncbi:hypothetical protein KKF38_00165 [Patescibacteria group bacterium]|nr:hypothetical protein [Patescibacteria group bacterium]
MSNFDIPEHKLKILHDDLLDFHACHEKTCRAETDCLKLKDEDANVQFALQFKAQRLCAGVRLRMKANFSRENEVCEQLEKMLKKLNVKLKVDICQFQI